MTEQIATVAPANAHTKLLLERRCLSKLGEFFTSPTAYTEVWLTASREFPFLVIFYDEHGQSTNSYETRTQATTAAQRWGK